MLFIIIWFAIAGIQTMIILVAGKVFEVSPDGLNKQQWAISIICAFAVYPVDFLLKFVPDSIFPELGKKTVTQDEKKDDPILSTKRSSKMHRRVTMRISSQKSIRQGNL